MQDKQGYVWIPSDKGITKFNGRSFKTFTQKDGLLVNDIFSSQILNGNQTWIYDHSYATTYIEKDTVYVQKYPRHNLPKPTMEKRRYKKYNNIITNYNGNSKLFVVWSNGHVFSIPVKQFLKEIPAVLSLLHPKVFSDTEFYESHCVFSTNGKKMVFSYDSTIIIYDFYSGEAKSINCGENIYYDFTKLHIRPEIFSHYFIYIKPKSKQLRFINLNTYEQHTINLRNYNKNYINSIVHMEVDSVFSIISQDGMLIRINNKPEVIDTFRWLGNEKINNIAKDKQGNYWISSYNDGLFLISKYLSPFKKLKAAGIRSRLMSMYEHNGRYFLFDNEAHMYITDKKFNILHKRKFKTLHKSYPEIKKFWFYPDKKDGYFIASAFGTYYLTNNYDIINVDGSFLRTSFKDFFYDPNSRRLIIGQNAGFAYIEAYPDLSLSMYNNPSKQYREYRILNVSMAPDGKYWGTSDVGTIIEMDFKKSGFGKIDLNKKIAFSTFDDSTFLFAVEGYAIYGYHLPTNQLKPIHKDENFQFYKKGGNGIWVANENYIAKFVSGPNGYIIDKKYLNLEGMIYNEVYDISECKDGNFLLCDNGIIKLPADDFSYADTAFTKSAYLSFIKLGNEAPVYFLKEDTTYKYVYTPEGLSLNFTCNSTAFLGNIEYRYFIKGSSTSWQETSEESVNYPALAPGTYKVHLKAVVKHLGLETEKKVFTLIVLPRWWQSIWFKILIGILVSSAIGFLFFLRVRAIKKRAKTQSELNKKMASLELTALQSQMNPHFIFNSLTSIQSFINTNRSEDADLLLRQFSLLVRLYLEFSRSKFITIEQELKSLHIYTDIERMRFGNKFATIFKLRNQASETLNKVFIPPMLVQPLVENAINHGLYHRNDNDGVLKIFFLVSTDKTVIIVDDNGIGRSAAKKLRNKIFPSLGNELINERLQVLNDSGRAKANLVITDKTDHLGNSKGTRVVLTIINIDYDKSDNR